MTKAKKTKQQEHPAVDSKGGGQMKSISNQTLIVDDRYGHEITMLPIEKIVPNDYNPNKMSSQFFDELARDMEETGVLSAILVCPREDGMYEIIDGEHRFEIAKLKDLREVPCIIAKGKLAENRDERIFTTMRMNTLRGQTDYRKLKEVVKELAERHDMSTIAERLLYADEHQLRALIDEVRTTLPSEEMRKEFDKAKNDLKTVDDLTLLIKRLFTKYGDTLEYGYMFLDYGGKDSIWIRISNKQEFKKLAGCISKVRDYGVTADSAVVTLITEGMTDEFFTTHKDKLVPAAKDEKPDTAYLDGVDDLDDIDDLLNNADMDDDDEEDGGSFEETDSNEADE